MPVSDASPKHLAEYSWEQEFQGRRFPVKVRVFFTPLAKQKFWPNKNITFRSLSAATGGRPADETANHRSPNLGPL
jgi:hypothetical protein